MKDIKDIENFEEKLLLDDENDFVEDDCVKNEENDFDPYLEYGVNESDFH